MIRLAALTRRQILLASATVPAIPVANAAVLEGGRLRAVNLRTANRSRPLDVEDRAPSLSWQIEGGVQSAYRIRVASSGQQLAAGKPDLWDSGRIQSGACSGIAYGGAPLSSRQSCYWTVELWNDRGEPGPAAETSFWEMGLLRHGDWHGTWLAAETAEERDDRLAGAVWVTAPAGPEVKEQEFRLSFESEGGEATLTIVSEGTLKLALDDRALALPERDPGGFGGAPAARLRVAVGPGRHVVTARVQPTRGYSVKYGIALAGQVHLETAGGAPRRLGDNWELKQGDGWIAAPRLSAQPNFPWPPAPARYLRRRFAAGKRVTAARLHVAALGGYEVTINGQRVSEDLMQSEPADYRARIPYRTYDVTDLIAVGENVIGLHVADGWYASYLAPTGRYSFGPAPRRIRAQLELRFADGSSNIVATDEQWSAAASPIRQSEIYDGERFDAAHDKPGWDRPGYDARAWDPVWTAPEPSAALTSLLSQPIRQTRILRPRTIRASAPGRHIVDFGQNFAGRVRLKLNGAAGQRVTLRHAEIVDDKGELDVRNLRAAEARDEFVLAAAGKAELEPRFTYHGFRYVEVSGVDWLTPDMVEGVVLGSDLPETGIFRIDRPLIQKLWQNTLWSQRSNFFGVPTDCPQRDERLGWTGDAQVFWDTAAFNMDIAGFTRNFTRALRDAQAPDGAFPLWAPTVDVGGFGAPGPTPGWADAGVMLPYIAYLHSGDRQIVDENWRAMTRYLEGILANNPDGLWRNVRGADLGDWLSLDAKQPMDATTPKALIGSAMLVRSIDQLAAMGRWTGRVEEATRWEAIAARSRAAFAAEFVDGAGKVGNGSHTSYIFALHLRLIPEAQRPVSAALLAADIKRRGTLLSTGFLGTPVALDALADHGQEALVWALLERTDYPSWGYMAARGATTIWERWNGDTGDVAMNSFNHYALGAVCGFLYRRVAGIAPLKPGWERFAVRPLVGGPARSAGATCDTVRGRAEVHWVREDDRLTLELTVPSGAQADVEIAGFAPDGPGAERALTTGTHRLRFKALR